MENGKNNIENLYSNAFGNYEDTPSNDEWKALSTKLVRVNFMKFSFTTFNVYYLSALLALAGSTAYLGVNNYILSSKNISLEMQVEKMNQSIIRSNVSSNKAKTIQTHLPIAEKNVKNTSPQKNIISSTNNIESSVIENEPDKPNEIVVLTDTVPAKIDTASVSNVAPKKIKKVRKTVYVKQPQVVVKDTVIINSKVK